MAIEVKLARASPARTASPSSRSRSSGSDRSGMENYNFLQLLYTDHMGLIAEREQMVRNIVRLRRAERTNPETHAIVAVRGDLERAVGSTVSRAISARLLGISQTALDRRIEQGAIPGVLTPRGRREVPLSALIDLVEGVEERRRTRNEARPVAGLIRSQQAAADDLDTEAILPRRYRREAATRGHGHAELQGLAYHRVVAQRLNAEMVDDALHRLRRWRAEEKIYARYADAWERLLHRPLPTIKRVISQNGQRARDLRQNSPFAGALTEPDRRRVLEATSGMH
ncbi:MAG: hypothetical protein ABI611_19255 [Solirubrobacteraceae bacterium]